MPDTKQTRTQKGEIQQKKKRKRNKRIIISTVIILTVAIFLTAWYLFSVYQTYQQTLKNIADNDLPTAEVVENITVQPFSILFIGIGTNGSDGQATLADSINLFTINPEANYAEAIAVPRDSYLPFGSTCDWGVGYFDKITHATSSSCLQTSLEDVFDVKINYYISVDFLGFISIVDALGGVEMDVPDLRAGFEAYPGDPSDGAYLDPALKNGEQWCEHNSNRDPFAICFSQFGPQLVNGEQALALARSRHYDGDFGRSLRQSELIKAIIEKATSASAITSANSLLSAVGDSIDTNIPSEQFFTFADLGKELLASKDSGTSDAFQIRTTQLSGIGGNFVGNRISQKLYFSTVPIASIEDIRRKIHHSLTDGAGPISPESFDFSIVSDSTPQAFTNSDVLMPGHDVSDPADVRQFRS